jgi:tRNA (guanine37-N1)-methyltransferase
MCQPIYDAVEHVRPQAEEPGKVVLLSPQGRPLDQALVAELAAEPRLILLAGHYEGFDERIRTGLADVEISVGDFVLSGGEIAAMALADAVVRLLPGALGKRESVAEESFSMGLLEYPQYTRPRVFRGMGVPEVLLSGDHARIAAWRAEQAERRTQQRRPDLWEKYVRRRQQETSTHNRPSPEPPAGPGRAGSMSGESP